MASKRKPASKPRKTKLELRRSRAAKKGWATRRRKQEELVSNASIGDEVSRLKRELAREKAKTKNLEKEQAKLARKQIETIQDFMNSEEWVSDDDWLMTRKDGSRAKHPSRLRLLPMADGERERLVELAGFDPILNGVKKLKNATGFYRHARKLSDFYDIPIREVYTLFWSP